MPHHDDRPDLAGEHPFGDMGQLIFLVFFLVVWVLDSFLLKFSTCVPCLVPPEIRIGVSIFIAIIGVILAKNGHDIVFGEVREPPSVIRKGVFGVMRHPLYTAALLFYLALIVTTRSFLAILVFVGITAFYNYIARHEESKLLHLFGEEYRTYMQDVPRWFPRIWKRK
ncbi:isoprenylcysteine carboxylmethyltransferase family protein [candidate division KSB1 bacterium]|nr:isoprenylcysteine carboxylmethyltransferase family protein [candidate division KSB1 bacterium]